MSEITTIKILFLENEEDAIESVEDSAENYCEDKPYKFEIHSVPTVEEALSEIHRKRYDLVLIDLDLGRDEESGNKFAIELLDHLRIPGFIYSGKISDSKVESKGKLFRHFSKSGDIEEMFKSIIEIFESGYQDVFGNNGLLDKKINKVYWDHLAGNILLNKYKERDKLHRLLRYSLSIALELSSIDHNHKSDQFEPDEVYIKPAIKEFYTGNIVTKDDDDYIIVTPACDMERIDPSSEIYITLCELNYDKYKEFIEKHKLKTTANRVEEIIKELNRDSKELFVLPQSEMIDGSYIEFRNIKSVMYKDLIEKYSVKHSISSYYMRNIQAKFAILFSRQGNPETNAEFLNKIMFGN